MVQKGSASNLSSIENNLTIIKSRIAAACERVGREPSEMELMLVTKTVEVERIEEAISAGATLFGENKIQELTRKWSGEGAPKGEWNLHFIGHLQTNKIKEAIRYSSCIESIDRLRLAERLQRRLEFEDKTIDVLLQVNTSYEESKFGVDPMEAVKFAQEVAHFERINIKGLMTIGLFSAEEERVRRCFKLLKRLQLEMLDKGIPVHQLSMGMSSDFEVAIEEGATRVRVGTSIFGERPYPDSYYWNEG